MTSKNYVLDSMKRQGRNIALNVQEKAPDMTGTELNAESQYIPDFQVACAKMNMLERVAGFVCKSTAGRVVRLIQPYDSTIYTAEPEELSAQWGMVWSTNPVHALPFIELATSPYKEGDCCTENGNIYRSKINGNTWSPATNPEYWKEVQT